MTKRIVALALVASVAVIGAALYAWSSHVEAIGSLLRSHSRLAAALLDARASDPRALLDAVRAPGLRVIVEDSQAGFVLESTGATDRQHAATGPPPFAPEDTPPDLGGPPGEPPRPRAAPLDRFIAEIARVAPVRVRGDCVSVVVAPDIVALRSWLIGDAVILGAALVAIAAGAMSASAKIQSTERRALEATLEERRAAAAEFQRFLADAGHELRTPLTIVSGYVDILENRLLAGDERDAERILIGMKTQTARMRGLVEKMLLLAKLETPVSIPRLVDAGAIAGEAVQAMRERYAGREIVLHGGEHAPLVIDQDDLYEALHNLIENALKYAPRSAVSVRISTSDSRVELRVTDTGPGIAESERQKVFERFYRGEDRADVDGCGLGLAIVKRVADRWSGAVDLDSRPGMTAFTLQFPLAAVDRS